MILAALALLFAAPTPIDNVHKIYCSTKDNTWQGTGWFIRDGVMATALHVANHDRCTDGTTGETVKAYKTDANHDFALMSGSHGSSVVKYSCSKPVPGWDYISYGWTSDFDGGEFWSPVYRKFTITATSKREILIPGLWNLYPMREYEGSILHGMSGGPVTNSSGVAYALNNAGDDETTFLYDLADTALCTGKWD
jgi:hypothetical protein